MNPNSPTGADPWIGQIIERRYEVEALLWRGELSCVYRVRDVRYKHRLALKLYGAIEDEAKIIAQIERELDLLGHCRSPHLVRFYEVVLPATHSVGIVMDLVHGQSLGAYLEQHGPMPAMQALHLIRQLANALLELHLSQVMHLNLKPSNIMIELLPSGEPFLHLLDFSSARSMDAHSKTSSLPITAYTSPEHAAPETLDGRSDLYSVGALLYLMLTGSPPFSAQRDFELFEAHRSAPRPRLPRTALSEVDDAQRQELEVIIHVLMSASPSGRFQDARELIARIDALLQQLRRAASPHERDDEFLFTRSLAQELSEGLSETIDEELQRTLDGTQLLTGGLHKDRGLWSEVFTERPLPYEVAVSFQTQSAAMCFEEHLELRHFLPEQLIGAPANRSRTPIKLPEQVTSSTACGDLFLLGTERGNVWRMWMINEPRVDVWASLDVEMTLPVTCMASDHESQYYLAQTAQGRLHLYTPQTSQWRPWRQLEPALAMSYHGRSGKLALLTHDKQLLITGVASTQDPIIEVAMPQAKACLCYSPDGYLLIVDLGDRLSVQLTESPERTITSLERPDGVILSMGFNRAGQLMGLIHHKNRISWRALWKV